MTDYPHSRVITDSTRAININKIREIMRGFLDTHLNIRDLPVNIAIEEANHAMIPGILLAFNYNNNDQPFWSNHTLQQNGSIICALLNTGNLSFTKPDAVGAAEKIAYFINNQMPIHFTQIQDIIKNQPDYLAKAPDHPPTGMEKVIIQYADASDYNTFHDKALQPKSFYEWKKLSNETVKNFPKIPVKKLDGGDYLRWLAATKAGMSLESQIQFLNAQA